jgi:hypothetical protein
MVEVVLAVLAVSEIYWVVRRGEAKSLHTWMADVE